MMRKDAMMRESGMEMGMEEGYDEMMAQLQEIYGDRYAEQFGMGTSEEEKFPGFVVSIVGYSPYADPMALLDPTGVEDKPELWGFVTRLDHIDEFVDANSPYELFSKDAQHFRLEKGAVDLDTDVPIGVGDSEIIPDESATTRSGGSRTPMMMMGYNQGLEILVDPVTRERIDAEPLLDRNGNVLRDALGKARLKMRDSWFQLDFKLKWEHAPEIDSGTSTTGVNY
jgi:hypothetical protein